MNLTPPLHPSRVLAAALGVLLNTPAHNVQVDDYRLQHDLILGPVSLPFPVWVLEVDLSASSGEHELAQGPVVLAAQPLDNSPDVSRMEIPSDQLSDHEQLDEILKSVEADSSTRAKGASDARRDERHLIPRPQAARRHPGQGSGTALRERDQ
jgi:hypothetical protein